MSRLISSRIIIFLSVVLVALALCISATFSWDTESHIVRNTLEKANVNVKVIQTSDEKLGVVTKDVSLVNRGDVDSIARVSINEYLMNFVTNVQNTDLATFTDSDDAKKVDKYDVSTWVVGAYQKAYAPDGSDLKNQTGHNLFYKVSTVQKSEKIGVDNSTRNANVYPCVMINWTSDLNENWVYEDGYFYYKKVLRPAECTPNLIVSVTLLDSFYTTHKGAKYKIDVEAESLVAVEGILESGWELEKNTVAYRTLNPLLYEITE